MLADFFFAARQTLTSIHSPKPAMATAAAGGVGRSASERRAPSHDHAHRRTQKPLPARWEAALQPQHLAPNERR